jgi:hypothetical protein
MMFFSTICRYRAAVRLAELRDAHHQRQRISLAFPFDGQSALNRLFDSWRTTRRRSAFWCSCFSSALARKALSLVMNGGCCVALWSQCLKDYLWSMIRSTIASVHRLVMAAQISPRYDLPVAAAL